MIKPVASVKKLLVMLSLAPDLPVYASGDEKRLLQIILNLVGNAIKFSKEGSISVTSFIANTDSLRDLRFPDFYPVPSDNHFHLCVQVGLIRANLHTLFGDVCVFWLKFSMSLTGRFPFLNAGKRFRIRN